jgi:hypothetical protein
VHPTTLGALVLLSRLVSPLPIALGIPPQAEERDRQSGWRLGCGERFAKIVQSFMSPFRSFLRGTWIVMNIFGLSLSYQA